MESTQYINILKQENDEIHISLKGEFVLTQIKRVYEELQAVTNVIEKKVFITLKEMKSLDLTGIQLIHSLKKSCNLPTQKFTSKKKHVILFSRFCYVLINP